MKYLKAFEAEHNTEDNFLDIVDAVDDYQTFVLGMFDENKNDEESRMHNEVEVKSDTTQLNQGNRN